MKKPCLVVFAICLFLFASKAWSAPVCVVSGESASDIERYATNELMSYLPRLTRQGVSDGVEDGTVLLVGTRTSNPELGRFRPALPETLATQEILVRSGSIDGKHAVAVTGGSPAAVLWAAYALLEKLGVVFEYSGEIVPPRQTSLDLKGIEIRESPSIPERGIRLHLNFPMDQSSYSLPEFLAWVDRIARMKMNYLELHFYSAQPWLFCQFLSVKTQSSTFFVGSSKVGGKYELPSDMIGRKFIRNKEVYFPPELEGMSPGEELYLKAEARIRAVIDHAHARGIKVALSFEPLAPPSDFISHLEEWDKEYGGHDQIMHELTVARLNACMDAYPNADEFQLISVEGSDDFPPGTNLKAELKSLCDKYKIPFDLNDERQFSGTREAGVNLVPYNTPSIAENLDKGLMHPVVSTLRFADFALNVLSDPRVADRMKRENRHDGVSIYLPNASAVKLCLPALRVMLPPQMRFQMMVDYGARETSDQMASWDALHGANLQLGVISWLEFDGSMFLPQAWPRSVFDCVRNASGLPLTTLVCNSWRVSGLEADSATLANAPWTPDEDYDTFMRRYFSRVFGPTNAGQARNAYDALEQATLYCRAHLFNVGFCWEGRYRWDFKYPQNDVAAAEKLFTQAHDGFNTLARQTIEGRPRQRAEMLANRCSCALLHLEVMTELAKADAAPTDGAGQFAKAPEHAAKAAELAREYMQTYSKFVLDRSDEGMLVNYYFSVIRTAAETVAAVHRKAMITNSNP
jgi:hypothetical protein